ncbi:MAG: adenylosuccinate lyase [SAR324 cluster bacterium]|uniref:Adenylosuccinate lyase n=1 Tax=SAR324 cluster bacterium TaxID=2024889 RepID=A0A7X9FTY3_9DELT|nr:adenylosuccinate lyase [SAR324 cluster bacterium]
MIPRYSRPEMQAIWSDESKYSIWLEVELLALKKMTELGLAPKGSYESVSKKARFDVARIQEIEAEVKHDVIAFLTCVVESAGPEAAYLHRGMTSSDLLDTSFAVQLSRSGDLLRKGLLEVIDTLKERALEFKDTPCIGRSHGIHAEPTTFGLKLLNWYAELHRHLKRFDAALSEVKVGKIAGAVGTYGSLDPAIEAYVMEQLGLRPETVPTQIVARDRHAVFFNELALLATSIERCTVEIRHLQRTEVREAEEEFTRGQKGSSAMPHKRNPILSENLSGLARLIRGYAQTAMENVVLWHERDISHSSAERVIAPDACILMDFMLSRFKKLAGGLKVYPERMKANLESTRGLIFSGALLVALVEAGMQREDAYRIVQKHALDAWESEPGLRERVEKDPSITLHISKAKLDEVFDVKSQLKHVDFIFNRALKNEMT